MGKVKNSITIDWNHVFHPIMSLTSKSMMAPSQKEPNWYIQDIEVLIDPFGEGTTISGECGIRYKDFKIKIRFSRDDSRGLIVNDWKITKTGEKND